MKAFQQNLKQLEAADTQVLGVSMDSPFANKAFADQIGVTFPLLSDWGGEVTHEYGVYVDKYKAARRVNFLIGKDGKILEEQVDRETIDPKKIVDACERKKLNRGSGCVDAGETQVSTREAGTARAGNEHWISLVDQRLLDGRDWCSGFSVAASRWSRASSNLLLHTVLFFLCGVEQSGSSLGS